MILIINSAEPDIREFIEPLSSTCKDNNIEYQCIEYRQITSCSLEQFNGIIISGSPTGDDIVDHHKPYYEPLLLFHKPIFGICAGHHILGSFFGAQLIRMQQKEIGTIRVKVLTNNPIFNNHNNEFDAYTMHHDSITVPNEFELIATSQICKNQMMKHRKYPWYTMQFHPEYNNHDLIVNFIHIAEKKT